MTIITPKGRCRQLPTKEEEKHTQAAKLDLNETISRPHAGNSKARPGSKDDKALPELPEATKKGGKGQWQHIMILTDFHMSWVN
jgi:hypothetical protein